MALLNHTTREITAKVVYYGPGLCGKTSNLKYIYESLEDEDRGRMLTLATEADRTLFFDFLPVDLGTMRGFRVRLQLYTVPGQVFYEETRKRVLKGCDGVVFVADSQRQMAEANKESLAQLHQHLSEKGIRFADVAFVLQYNKRDLQELLTVEEMDIALNPENVPFFEAVASEGIGVEDTLKAIIRLVLMNLSAKGALNSSPEVAAARLVPQGVATPVASGIEPRPSAIRGPGESIRTDTDPGISLSGEHRELSETIEMPLPVVDVGIHTEAPPPNDPEWLFADAGEETGNLLYQGIAFEALVLPGGAGAPLQPEALMPVKSVEEPKAPAISPESLFDDSSENSLLVGEAEKPLTLPENLAEAEKETSNLDLDPPVTKLEKVAPPATVMPPAIPSSPDKPHPCDLKLSPGEPFEADVTIDGRKYRLFIQLLPV